MVGCVVTAIAFVLAASVDLKVLWCCCLGAWRSLLVYAAVRNVAALFLRLVMIQVQCMVEHLVEPWHLVQLVLLD